ncbi:hypothetical protein HAX54_037369 [Datura stramonium]|uniref:Uncharacterized protein n=1 Tax=Datura stramonium TaxID=4076 RepID=A0ABS8SGZ2_DATST|nr:hypothetical protein [Datura stramonium]
MFGDSSGESPLQRREPLTCLQSQLVYFEETYTNNAHRRLADSHRQSTRIEHIHFGLAGMEEYYMSFKEKWSIHAKTQFEVESFKIDFSNIYYHIGMRDWGPFTIPADPYFPELGQEVQITPEAINSLYWVEPIKPHSVFRRNVEDKANQFQWVSSTINIIKLAKVIPSMIQQAIKRAMQPARDKLRGLCATVEVLENDVIALRKDVAALTGPPPSSNPIPPELVAVTSQPEAPKSPPDD